MFEKYKPKGADFSFFFFERLYHYLASPAVKIRLINVLYQDDDSVFFKTKSISKRLKLIFNHLLTWFSFLNFNLSKTILHKHIQYVVHHVW